MSGKISGTTLVKSPILWISIVAIIVVLLCLCYLLISRAQKQRYTSNSTIDIKHVGGKNDKNNFDQKKFRKDILDDVDKKIKKDREDGDKKNEEKNKKNEEKMKKMEEEIKTIKENNQNWLDGLKEKVTPLVDEVIEEQFKTGLADGPRMQAIKQLICTKTADALDQAKEYADHAVNHFQVDPIDVKQILYDALKQYNAAPNVTDWLNFQEEIDKKLSKQIYNMVLKTLSANAMINKITPSDRPHECFYISTGQAKQIADLMGNVRNPHYDNNIFLQNCEQGKDSYRVSKQNVESIFPRLALSTLQHKYLFKQDQQGQ